MGPVVLILHYHYYIVLLLLLRVYFVQVNIPVCCCPFKVTLFSIAWYGLSHRALLAVVLKSKPLSLHPKAFSHTGLIRDALRLLMLDASLPLLHIICVIIDGFETDFHETQTGLKLTISNTAFSS